MMSEWRLSQAETRKLINLYREQECLWNYKSSLYKRNDKKNKAWDDIAKEFQRDVMEIKKKVKNLRSAYVAEKKKVEDSLRSGSSAEEVYESHLYYYSDFSFLDAVIVLRKTQSNFNLDDTLERAVEATEQDQMAIETAASFPEDYRISSPPTFSPPMLIGAARRPSGRRPVASSSSRSARYQDAIAAILQKSSSPPETGSKYLNFGKSIANQLEELTPSEAAAAMVELQEVISRHVVKSLQRSTPTPTSSSLSSSNEGGDMLQNAIWNSALFEEF